MKCFLGVTALAVILGATADAQTGGAMAEHEFVARMLQHHQDGIEMARVAEQKGTTAEVKALARRIREARERDAKALQPFRPSEPAPRGTSGQQPLASAMSGRVSDPTKPVLAGDSRSESPKADKQAEHGLDHYTNLHEFMNALERVRSAAGDQVDAVFLNEMAKHHERALQMTARALRQIP